MSIKVNAQHRLLKIGKNLIMRFVMGHGPL